MPLKVIESRRLYLQIAGQIRSLIVKGEFPSGRRLPAERELAKQLGVSRPSLREALIALEVEGFVDVRPGSGILVTTPQKPAPDYSEEEGPLEIMRARALLEGEIAARAAPRMRRLDLKRLGELLVAMGAAGPDTATRLAVDCRFHLLIAARLDNAVLLRLVTNLIEQRNSLMGRQFAAHFDNAKTWAAVLQEHRKIVDALTTKNPTKARKAMELHLSKAHDRWARQIDHEASHSAEGARGRRERRPDQARLPRLA